MGVHWVNPGLLVSGVVDSSRPTVLEYATIEGQPTLVGIAYVVLADDTTPPPDQPAPAAYWHTHGGSVDEESFVLSHAESARHHHDRAPGPKIAILHAWIWLANPDGLFATDNWALPFARLGFAAPESVTADAGRAMALAAGGVEYFRTLVRVVARPDSADQERLDAVLAASTRELARTVGHGNGRTPLTRDQVTYLEAAWRRTWGALLGAGSVAVRESLASLEEPVPLTQPRD
jgi:hypothetical protein